MHIDGVSRGTSTIKFLMSFMSWMIDNSCPQAISYSANVSPAAVSPSQNSGINSEEYEAQRCPRFNSEHIHVNPRVNLKSVISRVHWSNPKLCPIFIYIYKGVPGIIFFSSIANVMGKYSQHEGCSHRTSYENLMKILWKCFYWRGVFVSLRQKGNKFFFIWANFASQSFLYCLGNFIGTLI